jgi:hypothetical protein
MTPKGSSSRKIALGRAEFVVRPEDETLAVELDRKGFRRLLLTLEELAKSGHRQEFERSGRQHAAPKGNGTPRPAIVRLRFSIDD